MSDASQSPDSQTAEDFARQADAPRPGFVAELWTFLCQEKRWWLTPIVVLLVLLGVLVLLSGTAMAPFIYTLF
ncbi:MAG: DUF5989 family protein [Myxococcales bacterium]|nr:DUF5989 family protein [Myxococcales bacterium]